MSSPLRLVVDYLGHFPRYTIPSRTQRCFTANIQRASSFDICTHAKKAEVPRSYRSRRFYSLWLGGELTEWRDGSSRLCVRRQGDIVLLVLYFPYTRGNLQASHVSKVSTKIPQGHAKKDVVLIRGISRCGSRTSISRVFYRDTPPQPVFHTRGAACELFGDGRDEALLSRL
ncbi:hypothetical protein DENSPDRAFT_428785 [Dentipellis sp. KUC8613]|nr:hypothetical protein DENSPDRAFT_428785 [Dentipellis sp. KUC8613]